jgi:hypothetical protein
MKALSSIALIFAAASPAAGANHVRAADWTIGPITPSGNHSIGMPLRPAPERDGFRLDLPRVPGRANYVTFHHGPLTGKSRIVMRYRVEAAPGAKIVPASAPQLPSMITLYFQRSGDDWSARGPFEAYRWYATFATQSPIAPGGHVMVAPLSGNWTAVVRSSARSNPAAFGAALREADQVGFVLGGGDGVGHGVFATGPARLIVEEFRVE